jgi:hypothetical protein
MLIEAQVRLIKSYIPWANYAIVAIAYGIALPTMLSVFLRLDAGEIILALSMTTATYVALACGAMLTVDNVSDRLLTGMLHGSALIALSTITFEPLAATTAYALSVGMCWLLDAGMTHHVCAYIMHKYNIPVPKEDDSYDTF